MSEHTSADDAELDWPLPCDVRVGNGTHRKGTSLRTLVVRMRMLHEAAFGPQPSKEEQAANLAALQSVARNASELDRLQRRVVDLEKDAARYRWLRDAPGAFSTYKESYFTGPPEGLDAAIDAALSEKP